MPKRRKSGPAAILDSHPNLPEIRLALANGIAGNRIAEKYGVSPASVWRYGRKMTPEEKSALRYRTEESPIDLEALKRSEAEMVVQRNLVMLGELYAAWRLCIENEDFHSAASLAGKHFRYAELQSKIVGELQIGDRHLHVQVADSPQYRKLVSLVMAWASDKPDLAADLARFLEDADTAVTNGTTPPLIEAAADA